VSSRIIFIARSVSFSIAGKRGGKTGYPRFCISLSAFLMKAFLGMLNGASTAMIFGAQFIELSKISLSRCKWQVDMVLFLNIAQPVGFVVFPAKSIPTMMFFSISLVACLF